MNMNTFTISNQVISSCEFAPNSIRRVDWNTFKALIFLVLVLSSSASIASSSSEKVGLPEPKVAEIVASIYRIEGGDKAKSPYGILSVKVKNKEDARRICANTVRNNYARWQKAGAKGDYLDYLANVYCPKSADPKGNANWKKNIHKMVKL